MKRRMLCLVLVVVTCVCTAAEPLQGKHLRWATEFVSENTPLGLRDVGIVKILYNGQRIGQIDPRNLPISEEDEVDSCPDEELNCYPPGVTSEPLVLAITPDEKRLVFFVNIIPDDNFKFIFYFCSESREITPLGKINGGELVDFTFGPDPGYAFVKDDFNFFVINLKKKTIKMIPSVEDVAGEAHVPPDLIALSDGVWVKPNILSFEFHQELCQNPDAEISDRTFTVLPAKTCIYDFETGEVKVKNSVVAVQAVKGSAAPQTKNGKP